MPIHAYHAGVHYYEDLDVGHDSFDGYLSLNGTTVNGRVDARCLTIDGNANFRDLKVDDKFYAWAFDGDGNTDFSRGHLGDLYLRSGRTGHSLIGEDLQVDGDIDLKRFTADHIRFRNLGMDGTMYLDDTDADSIDLRGATVPQLWADDLDAYTFRTDDDTWIGDLREGYGLPDDPELAEEEQEFADRVYDRPLFPIDRRDGVVFTKDDLRKDFVLDAERHELLGNLWNQGVLRQFDGDRYALVSRQYR